MGIFIKKLFTAFILLILGILSFIAVVHLIIKINFDFKLPKSSKYVIIGHSHPACDFNDNLIANFTNLAKSGEGYFYNYQKVKEILSQNSIDAIFIEYSNNQIATTMDDWIWGYETMNAFFPWHSPFMSKKDILYLKNKNSKDFLKVVSTSSRINLTRILSLDLSIDSRFGGYEKLEQNKIKELIKDRDRVIKSPKKKKNISTSNIDYLEKIVEYCNNRNVKVYFIRGPQHKYFPRGNEKQLISIKEERFKNVDFLDFDNFPLQDSEFSDFGHLNYNGAKVFSSWFNELIKNGLLSKENKPLFVEKEMEKAQMHNLSERLLRNGKSARHFLPSTDQESN